MTVLQTNLPEDTTCYAVSILMASKPSMSEIVHGN